MHVSEIKEYQYFAGGKWRAAENKKLFDVFQPNDRGLYARVAAEGRPEAKLAVEAAAKAFPAWSRTTPAERAGLFLKAAEITKRRRTEIADILAFETGSTISFAAFHGGWGQTGPDSLNEFQDVIWINSHSGQRQYPI
jgi:acyl-CoA reductase-like NAD-dependent aldehyde dehydrogenase